MPLYELSHDALTALPETTMEERSFSERNDLQRLLRTSMNVLGEELFVLSEEFSEWTESKRRIDLLALDKQANLVVVELKRTEDGGHMELQAIRYAAMVSNLTFQQAVTAHVGSLRGEGTEEDARVAILKFLGWNEPSDRFAKSVRIVLVSPNFSKEITTAVLWLNESGLDIRCVRIRPYALAERTILDVEQIIPLPEAEAYTVQLKEKQDETRQVARAAHNFDFTKYDLNIRGTLTRNLGKRNLIWAVVNFALQEGTSVDRLKKLLGSSRLFGVPGTVGHEEFLARASESPMQNSTFDRKRYFTDEDRLLHVGGNTYALSNQWGIQSLPYLNNLIAELPGDSVTYTETTGSD